MVLVAIFGFYAYRQGRDDWLLGACAVWVLVALAGLIRQERLSTRYHCPQCGALLPYSPQGKEKRILFHCPSCDVVWDTGMMEGSAP